MVEERLPQRLTEDEIRQAIAHFLSRQGSAEYDVTDVFLWARPLSGEIVAEAFPRRAARGRE